MTPRDPASPAEQVRAIAEIQIVAYWLEEKVVPAISDGMRALAAQSLRAAAARLDALEQRCAALADAGEFLWAVVANASGSNWSLQSAEWQAAAARARDAYWAAYGLPSPPAAPAPPETEDAADRREPRR